RLRSAGYKMKITGGSTVDGFPMRKDLPLQGKRKLLVTYPSGKRRKDGLRRRLTVRGSVISSDNTQINVKIVQYGPTPIGEEEKDNE
ncbi:MAG: 30S ribosomal protein S6e, partial [Candidatus Thermoplasmatota archaeon]|nr:30S ribosomal protein S6e [Candidatus Thermoplasmatota archaeon]